PSPLCPPDWLVLQVPAGPLLEGDSVPLRCRGWRDRALSSVRFYREEEPLWGHGGVTELSLSPLQPQHGGRYRCRGWVSPWVSRE
ncbi:FCRLA protein, partial [Chaetops frenatus]|nr:FCRLA protein [Chaetops frenatus]